MRQADASKGVYICTCYWIFIFYTRMEKACWFIKISRNQEILGKSLLLQYILKAVIKERSITIKYAPNFFLCRNFDVSSLLVVAAGGATTYRVVRPSPANLPAASWTTNRVFLLFNLQLLLHVFFLFSSLIIICIWVVRQSVSLYLFLFSFGFL